MPSLSVRSRKLIGTVVLVVFLSVYALVAMVFTATRVQDASPAVQAIIFLVAGLAWVPPALLLVRWMQRPDDPA